MLSSIFCKTMCASINFKTATTRPCGPFFACSSAELPFQVFQSCFENVFSIAGIWVSVFLLFLQQHQQQQAIARMFQTPTKTEPKRQFFLLRSTTIVSLLILSTQQGVLCNGFHNFSEEIGGRSKHWSSRHDADFETISG